MILYCDQAAAAGIDGETADFFADVCRIAYANQESLHSGAFELRKALDEAGNEFARLLTGGDEFAVCWCSSGTDAFLLLEYSGVLKNKRAVTSALEHPALKAVLERNCCGVRTLKCGRQGEIIFENGDFDIAAFHSVQSELGTVQDIPFLMKNLPAHCIRFTDAVQSAGKMDMEKIAEYSDIIAVSGMKFASPGGGALLVRKTCAWSREFLKSVSRIRHPEYRAGRIFPPTALTCVYALQKCCSRMQDNLKKMRELNGFLRRELAGENVVFSVPENLSSPYILHLYLPGKQGGVAVRMLSERGILAGSGSACAAESRDGSTVLRAIGYSAKESFSGLRLSFGFDFSFEQAEFLVKNLIQVLKNY